MKIGTSPSYKNRRLFVQKIKDRAKSSHEYYINAIIDLDNSALKMIKFFRVDMNIY